MIKVINRIILFLPMVLGLLLITANVAHAGCECSNGLKEPTKGACAKKKQGRCISGMRSKAKQAQLYATLPRGQAGKTSLHTQGLAIDISGSGSCPPGLKKLNSKAHKGTHCSTTGH